MFQKLKINLKFYLLCYLKFRDFDFKFVGKKTVDTGWSSAECYFKIKLPVENIYALIKNEGGLVGKHISETPHFHYLKSAHGKKEYFRYVENYFNLEESYSNKNFDDLIDSISNNGIKNPVLIKKDLNLPNKFRATIVDGVHRATILLSKNESHIECLIVHKNKI